MTDSNTRLSVPPIQNDRSGNKKTPHHPKGAKPLQPKVEVVKAVPKKACANKLTKLMAYLESIRDQNFTGYIKVNFSQGSIGRVERFKKDKTLLFL
jgi:hypothetical protein